MKHKIIEKRVLAYILFKETDMYLVLNQLKWWSQNVELMKIVHPNSLVSEKHVRILVV